MEEMEARLRNLYERLDRSDEHNSKMREILHNLGDAMLVQSQIEKRQSAPSKEHADLITRTERNLAEMTDKMNVLYSYTMKRDNLPEASH